MKSRIGCNTILTNSAGDEEPYTFAAYERLLADYTAYSDWIGALEFSHVTRITPREAGSDRAARQRVRLRHLEHPLRTLQRGRHAGLLSGDQKHEAEVCAALGCPVMGLSPARTFAPMWNSPGMWR